MAEKKTKAKAKAAAKPSKPKAGKTKSAKAALETPKVSKAKVASAADEFRAKSADELSAELGKLKKEQFNLRFQRATGQLENTARVREVRRDIARLKTIVRQKRAPKS